MSHIGTKSSDALYRELCSLPPPAEMFVLREALLDAYDKDWELPPRFGVMHENLRVDVELPRCALTATDRVVALVRRAIGHVHPGKHTFLRATLDYDKPTRLLHITYTLVAY